MKHFFCLLMLAFGLLISGCGSSYDEASVNHFTELKQHHLTFINRYTGNAERSYDQVAVRAGCDQVVREFDKAKTYMENEDEKDGLKALAILRAQFEKDCRFLHDMEKLYTTEYAAVHKVALSKNYDLAIAGKYDDVEELED
jgi:hypothetical protein